ncbi:MAG: branched-chain-amino-acid transaminase [Candidatus Dormibacteraeota bacterium]|nr:branched-chain-amino-acid transaminase [Candidatus Dormibacteraeota bacterium]
MKRTVGTSAESTPGTTTTAPDLRVYVNGELVPAGEARISVFDSGLNFADGVFEGVRVYGGRVFRLEQHVKRLYESANAFEIDIGMSRNEFTSVVLDWLRANQIRENFHFRPIVTRGNRFPPRLDPRFCSGGPNMIFVGASIEPARQSGVRTIISSVRQINSAAIDARIKSLNYGNNLLARLESVRRGADDALMLDDAGFLAEASAANLFLVKDGCVLTPWAKACLDGITRRTVMDLATAQGRAVVERDLSVTEILNADEVFLTGTGTEITPVVEVEGRRIGDGAAGAVTLSLQEAYSEVVRSEGTPIEAVP